MNSFAQSNCRLRSLFPQVLVEYEESSFESRLVILKDLQATNILDNANDTGLAALDAGDRLSCLTSMTANIHVFPLHRRSYQQPVACLIKELEVERAWARVRRLN